MRAYFVASHGYQQNILLEEKVDAILISYAYCKSGIPEKLLKASRGPRGIALMLDSGGFTNSFKPGTVKLDEYTEFLKSNKSLVEEYVTLDEPTKRERTVRNYLRMREAGLSPLLVDHLWFRFGGSLFGKTYQRGVKMCWGGMLSRVDSPRGSLGEEGTRLIYRRADQRYGLASKPPLTKLHLLAVGGKLRRFLPYFDLVESFDAATWVRGAEQFGKVPLLVPAQGETPPKFREIKVSGPAPREVRERAARANLDLSTREGRSRLYVRELKKYYRALSDFYVRFKNNPEVLRAEQIRKGTEPDLGHDLTYGTQVWQVGIELRETAERLIEERVFTESSDELPEVVAQPKPQAFARGSEIEKLKDARGYNPAKLRNDVLRDDFRIVLAWWAQRQKNPNFKHSPATLERLLRAILREAVRRGQDVIRFDPKGMEPSVRGFFLRVAREVGVPERMFKDEGAPPQQLASLEPGELTKLHDDLHRRFRREAAEARTVEPLVNLHARVVNELARNDKRHPPPPDDGLDAASRDFESAPTAKRYMTVHRSGEERGREITLAEVVERLDSFKVRKPFISIVGGLANHGSTKGDIDVLVNDDGSLPESFMHVLHFRLGRGLGDLADRLSIHTNKFNGPFTNFVELYDLTVERANRQTEVKEMSAGLSKPFSSPGGKRQMVSRLLRWMPTHSTYVEPFAGSASLYWAKEPIEREILADVDEEVIATYRFLKNGTDADFAWLRGQDWQSSESNFARLLRAKPTSEREQVYRFKYLNRHSRRGAGQDFDSPPKSAQHNAHRFLSSLERYRERLAKTTLLCQDWKRTLERFDSSSTFFYLDPPWREDIGRGRESWKGFNANEFLHAVKGLRAKVMLSWQGKPAELKDWSAKTALVTSWRGGGDRPTTYTTLFNFKHKRAGALSFTPMPKPTRPAMPGKRQTVDSFIELHSEREDWLPTLVQKKYDGVRAQIHRDGERVVVFTEQGEDITARLPALVDELKSLKPRSFVLDSELERWVGKQHLPREATSGYLSSKDEPDDSAAGIVANVFDVLSLDGRDTHELPVERRVELLDKLGIAQSTMEAPDGKHRLNRAPSKRVETPAQLRAATERIRRLPGSEGVVVKRVGSPYPLAKVTLDTWVKFHNATVLQGTVLGRERVQSGVWTYQWGVLPGKEKPKALDKSGKVVPVGDSFNTTRDAKAGDTIPIEAESVNLTRTPDGVELTAWVPRVLDEEPGKPDTVDTATKRARHDLVLQEKEVDAKGHVTYVPTRKSVAKQQDVYLIAPSEDGLYRYVVQHHYRGRGVHSDLRIELRPKRLLIGWTLNTMIEGTIKEPVLALSDAREHARRMAEVSKIDWNTGEWARRPKRGTPKLVRTTIAAERKAPEPFAWLNVEGATKKPEPGKPPPVGATRNFPGVFLIVDSGTAEYGAQKPWAHEYFFHGDALNYRVMFRMLRLGAKKRAGLPELCVMCKREPAVREVAWADEPESAGLVCDGCVAAWASRRGVLLKTILPPSKPPPAAPRGESWFAIRPDDPTPNVLSKAEVKKGWMPPHGKSALPRAVREQVPKELRYWDAPPAKARELRDALVEAIAKHEVKVDFEAPYRRPAKKLSQLDARFVLQEQTWHGPVQIRVGPSSTVWWLRVDTGAGKVLSLKLLASPLDNERVAALVSREPRSTMSVSGQVPPGTPLNPTKETPSVIATVDKGKASLLNVSDDWLKLKIAGERLKGLFGVKRNKPGDEWLWAPAEPAPVVEKVSVGEADGYALTVPIIKADEERGIITGIALEPEVRDAQGDIISAEVIEKAAYDFLARYGRADGTKLGIMHRKFGDIGWDLIESWIQRGSTSVNGQRVRDGSWMLSWRKTPDALGKAAWERVKRGELTGFSIGGFAVTR